MKDKRILFFAINSLRSVVRAPIKGDLKVQCLIGLHNIQVHVVLKQPRAILRCMPVIPASHFSTGEILEQGR